MLDEKDKEILQLLQKDGRISLSKIGEEIGMSHVAVRKRMKKLREEILQINPALNFEELDYRLTLLSIEAKDDEVREELIETFQDCPRIVLLLKTTGEYNLLAVMLAENQNVQESQTGQCAIRTHPGIRRSEINIGEVPVRPENIQYTPPLKNKNTAPCGEKCDKCQRYLEEKCLGCPSTRHYRL
ncbi:MAG: AsnC family transcriptional regulator [Hadesarchaea archaeon]|nr:AsnC family transcriptional regulator [Hadesarchaea archaeon]